MPFDKGDYAMTMQDPPSGELVDIIEGRECLLRVMDQNFMVTIGTVGEDQVEVSFPGLDYPVPGMSVQLQFHDETGFNGYCSDVIEGPQPDRRCVVLRKPTACERSMHRDSCRVPTDLTVQVKDHVHVRRYDARLINLSGGGALMATQAPFDFSTNVDITLSLPGDCTRTLLGQIVHMNVSPQKQGDDIYTMGVRFVGLDASTSQSISRYAWSRLKELFPGG